MMKKVIAAKNPIIPGEGVCDPHIHIFNNKAYLYATHDLSRYNSTYVMKDWEIWSSGDLVEWQKECVITSEETYMGSSNICYATDAAERNGKYYFYFSNGNIDTGVMCSDNPGGLFVPALRGPLLAEDLTKTRQYDPAVFVDDDEARTPYILFGTPVWAGGDSYYIARLNEDMISLAEPPRKIVVDDLADDKAFLHKHRGLYYLTWASYYAVSDNVYGSYRLIGNIGASEDHGSFFEWNQQWFFAFTIFDPSIYHRAVGICYIHYKDNGEMVADQMIMEHGVGQYDADWNKIEAEWYMGAHLAEKVENRRFGFDIGRMESGGHLYFPKIKNVKENTGITFYASCISSGGVIEVRENNLGGPLLGSCQIENTGSLEWMGYKTFTCKLDNTAGTKNLYLVFKGEGKDLFRLDWFKFNG